MLEGAGLSHEATCQRGAVLYAAAILDDEIVGNYTVAYVYGGFHSGHQRTVLQAACPLYLGGGPHVDVLYVARVHYGAVCCYGATCAGPFLGACHGHLLHVPHQHGAVAVHGSDVCLVRRQAVVYGHLSAPCLAKYGNLGPASETCFAVHQDYVAILYETILLDVVVGNVVLYVLYAAVVAHVNVVQRGMEYAAMLSHASGHEK